MRRDFTGPHAEQRPRRGQAKEPHGLIPIVTTSQPGVSMQRQLKLWGAMVCRKTLQEILCAMWSFWLCLTMSEEEVTLHKRCFSGKNGFATRVAGASVTKV